MRGWLNRLAVWRSKGTETPNIPDGWTDDMSIVLPPGRTVAELVEHVIQAALGQTPQDELARDVEARFGLSRDDAALALDRTFGGIVRAATRNPENRPSRDKDPVAWTSFHRATRDPSIIAALYPDFA
jgi:hypothetical protein